MLINKYFSKYDKLSMLGIMSFLIVISISNISTTYTSYLVIEIVRVLAALMMLICSFAMIWIKKIKYKSIIFFTLYLLFIVYSIFLSIFNGSFEIGKYNIAVNIFITIIGLFLLNSSSVNVINYVISKYYVYYAMCALIIIIAAGGLVWEAVPRFVYEVASDEIGREENYSLGISNFFGFAALAAASNIFQYKEIKNILFFSFICFVFMGLSFLGGGRGESIIAAIIIVVVALIKMPRLVFSTLLISIILYGYITSSIDLNEIIIFQRLEALFDGDLSSRDTLFLDGIKLLANEPRCLLIGCGIGYFQYYHNYEFGMFPHNFILESVIIFGFIISLVACVMTLFGIFIFYKKNKNTTAFLLFFLYSLLVGLKSGSLLGSWFLLAAVFYFCSLNNFYYFENEKK
jgi:hypothetical protein